MPEALPNIGAGPSVGQEPAAPEAAAPSAAPQQAGGVKELVVDVHQKMVELLSVLDQSQAVDMDDKKVLAGILQQYRGFIQENLSGGQGEAPPNANPRQSNGSVPLEAGNANVLPA